MNQLWRRCGLVLARFALSAWVGAALLFVLGGIRLVTADAFDSVDRDAIALIRFPLYYIIGAACMTLAMLGLFLAAGLSELSRRRWVTALILTVPASAMLLADYLWIYTPLAQMITPPGAARPVHFHTYHRASEMINAFQVGLCFAAACVCNWPITRRT
jgi:hypothetical protein